MRIPHASRRLRVQTCAWLGLGLLGVSSGERVFGLDVLHGISSGELPHQARSGVTGLAVADLDGDDQLDVAFLTERLDRLAWLESSGGTLPSFTEHTILQLEPFVSNLLEDPRALLAVDLDGDDDIDLVAGSTGRARLLWFENDGAPVPTFSALEIENGTRPFDIDAADIDGDDDIDLIVASTSPFNTAWFENTTGDGSAWARWPVASSPGSTPTIAGVDLDDDDDVDIVIGGNQLVWKDNAGGTPPTFVSRVISTTAWRDVAVADIDGDLDLDLVVCREDIDQVGWFENQGGTPLTFAFHEIDIAPPNAAGLADGPVVVIAADLDHDGDADVVTASQVDQRLGWFDNTTGDGTTWAHRILSASVPTPVALLAVDLDGGGSTDLLTATTDGDEVNWHPNRGAAAGPELTLHFEQFGKSPIASLPSFSGVGVAQVTRSAGGALTELSLVAGHLGMATTPVTTGPFDELRVAATLGTGVFPPAAPDQGIRGAGQMRYCFLLTLFPACTAFVRDPLSEGGGAALGIGGLLTVGGGTSSVVVSLRFAPWTVATVSVMDRTANGAVKTFTGAGFAHGPASQTSTLALADGVLQIVAPIQISRTGGLADVDGIITRLTVRFVPEPGQGWLLAGGGGLALWLGIRRASRSR